LNLFVLDGFENTFMNMFGVGACLSTRQVRCLIFSIADTIAQNTIVLVFIIELFKAPVMVLKRN
jgi:hypothetical protein